MQITALRWNWLALVAVARSEATLQLKARLHNLSCSRNRDMSSGKRMEKLRNSFTKRGI